MAEGESSSARDALDLKLLRAIASGDTHALDQLYELHGLPILSYLIGQLEDRVLAEEVLQDVMLAVWKGASGFRGDSKVRTWLLAIARHQAINARQRRKQLHTPLSEVEVYPSLEPGIESSFEKEHIKQALHQLPDDQRETLELIFYQELSGPEVATVLGIAPGTVKSRVHRAMATLRKVLSEEDFNHA